MADESLQLLHYSEYYKPMVLGYVPDLCVYCTASVMGLMFNQAKTVLSAVAYSLVLHAL